MGKTYGYPEDSDSDGSCHLVNGRWDSAVGWLYLISNRFCVFCQRMPGVPLTLWLIRHTNTWHNRLSLANCFIPTWTIIHEWKVKIMALTKADIVEAVQTEIGLTRHKSISIVESLLETIKSKLASGEDVLVSGLASSVYRRNVNAGLGIQVQARTWCWDQGRWSRLSAVGSYGSVSMATDRKIVCIFCGGLADIKKQNDLMVVSCPKCKRETELDTYQDIFDNWMGDIRTED
jgi:nucleoid DNA-binding protein